MLLVHRAKCKAPTTPRTCCSSSLYTHRPIPRRGTSNMKRNHGLWPVHTRNCCTWHNSLLPQIARTGETRPLKWPKLPYYWWCSSIETSITAFRKRLTFYHHVLFRRYYYSPSFDRNISNSTSSFQDPPVFVRIVAIECPGEYGRSFDANSSRVAVRLLPVTAHLDNSNSVDRVLVRGQFCNYIDILRITLVISGGSSPFPRFAMTIVSYGCCSQSVS